MYSEASGGTRFAHPRAARYTRRGSQSVREGLLPIAKPLMQLNHP